MEIQSPSRQKTVYVLGNVLLLMQVLLVVLWAFHEHISIPESLTWTGRMHPLFVHFPIALILLLIMTWFFRKGLADTPSFQEAVPIILLVAACFATLTAITGFCLSSGDDYDETLLGRHRNLGSLTAFLSYLAWIFYPVSPSTETARRPYAVYSVLLVFTGLSLVVASHFGGSLTHGEGYLFPELADQSRNRRQVTDSTPVFEASIMPLLESKCLGCHNDKKAKGGLVMTTIEGLIKGGKNGAPWIAGDPSNSLLVQRLLMDMSDKKHMPPKGKPQLTGSDIELIRYWVHRGADRSVAFRDLAPGDSLRLMAGMVTPFISITGSNQKEYDFPPVKPSKLASLQSPYRTLLPVHQGSPALELSFFVKQGFHPSLLKDCEDIKDNIVSINMARMPVGDSILGQIATFKNLETLNLSGTEVSDKGLSALSALRNLSLLILSETRVTASGLQSLVSVPSLKKVFVWQTALDAGGLAKLRKSVPGIQWITGTGTDPGEKLRLTPPQLTDPEKFIIQAGERVAFYHPLQNVQIRYTLDGAEPDSLQSPIYQSPLTVTEPVTMKAIAVALGWYASERKEFSFFPAGVKPLEKTLLSKPDPKYALQGAESLFDGQKGDINNLLVNWVGFREGAMTLQAGFDGKTSIRQVVISACINLGAYVFPPYEIIVRAGMSPGQWMETKKLRPEQPVSYGPQKNQAFIIPLKAEPYKIIEISVYPVPSLPKWHNGKKEKGWIFTDEIFFY